MAKQPRKQVITGIKDTDGKAGITTGDKTIIANTQPKFTFGLTNIINWNNFGVIIPVNR